MYSDLARPIVLDLHLTPLVFDLYRLRLTDTDAFALLDRLDLVHRLRPAQKTKDKGKGQHPDQD